MTDTTNPTDTGERQNLADEIETRRIDLIRCNRMGDYEISKEDRQTIIAALRSSPAQSRAGELVAWEAKAKVGNGEWFHCDPSSVNLNIEHFDYRPLYTHPAPPTERERETLAAHEILYALVNTLADPCDACDFEDSEVKALLATIQQALNICKELSGALRSPAIGGARDVVDAKQFWEALKKQCGATKDKSQIKCLVQIRFEDVVAALSQETKP